MPSNLGMPRETGENTGAGGGGSSDRRNGERRSGQDRRSQPDRRGSALSELEESDREHRNRLIIFSLGGFVLGLLPALVLYLLVGGKQVKTKQPGAASLIDDPFEEMREERRRMISFDDRPDTTRKGPGLRGADIAPLEATLRDELLRIAPELFSSVSLQLAETPGELELATVKSIDISVRSAVWDELPSDDKVDFVRKTFEFLQSRYPEVTRLARLIYDDNRTPLELEFDDDA